MIKFVLAGILFLFSLLLLKVEGLLKRNSDKTIGILMLVIVFGIRLLLMTTGDAENQELYSAMQWFHAAGGPAGLKSSALPYSLPVQLFISIFSLPNENNILYFKFFCLFMEIVTAWSVQRCISSIVNDSNGRLWAFLITLLIPAGIGETAYTANASLFGWSFLILSISFAFETKNVLSCIFLSLSILFTPDLLWIAPFFFVFPALRKNAGTSLLSLFGSYISFSFLFLLLGRKGSSVFPIYPSFSALYGENYFGGAPGLYSLVSGWPNSPAGVILYAGIGLLVCLWLIRPSVLRNKRSQLAGICLIAIALGALFPWLDASILYGACVLLLILSFTAERNFPAFLLVCAVSAVCVFQNHLTLLQSIPNGYLFLGLIASMIFMILYLLLPSRR